MVQLYKNHTDITSNLEVFTAWKVEQLQFKAPARVSGAYSEMSDCYVWRLTSFFDLSVAENLDLLLNPDDTPKELGDGSSIGVQAWIALHWEFPGPLVNLGSGGGTFANNSVNKPIVPGQTSPYTP